MPGKILLSTAYLPPAEYFFRILGSDVVIIEREENYIKQTYRNRCYILAPGGPFPLSVPVYLGSFHKTPVRDIRIDYSKRWQQVHIGALKASYSASPYFLYYFEDIEKILHNRYEFLLDLNMDLLLALLKMMRIERPVSLSDKFEPVISPSEDARYNISPKKTSPYLPKKYLNVFGHSTEFPSLSILDMIFNTGPEAAGYL